MVDILLVDDHIMIRDAIKAYFTADDNYRVRKEASNGQEALDILHQHAFNLVISDINMPIMNGVELMENIHINFPKTAVLALSFLDDIKSVRKMLTLGAKGYVSKNISRQQLIIAIESVLKGDFYYSQEIQSHVKNIVIEKTMKKREEPLLSNIEIQVLQMLIRQISHREIAKTMNLALRVIDLIIKNIFLKSRCKSTEGLVLFALDHQLIP